MQWNHRPFVVALALVAATGAARAQEPDSIPDLPAPQLQPLEGRYDAVGYASVQALGEAALAVSPVLAPDSYAEATALGSGRTILVRIAATAQTSGDVATLSEGAARQLGVATDAPIAVRIRAVRPSTEDQAALRSAGVAQPRIDSPPALLRALRLQLPPRPLTGEPLPPPPPPPATMQADPIAGAGPAPLVTPSPKKKTPGTPPKAAQGRYLVQVAALSSPERATALAQKLKGFVKAAGGLYRVQLGPFATEAAAERAQAEAVRAGFGDARRTTVR